MKLTYNEKREIISYPATEKPLPDKYRFLLFDDKREVELIWNGKTSEVSTIVLPFQVIEQVDEPRAEKPEDTSSKFRLFDFRGRQKAGWTNKLILSSLKNGPVREDLDVPLKMERLKQWCQDINTAHQNHHFDYYLSFGAIVPENMQIEGFWFMVFSGGRRGRSQLRKLNHAVQHQNML